ncbi:MAG: citramalate synthase, partial [Chloroflexi bacterium]|nr:citramalate synthase [Chloroflexota bacterium]
DTNGGAMPDDIARISAEVRKATGAALGIHTHNDADTAAAGALAAVRSGVTQVHGTINGYGERCGNANLISIIANLKLKLGVECVTDEQLASLTEVSRFVAETVNRRPFPFAPYVGASAFAHKGGLHAAAVEKAVESYQHVDPAAVGNISGVVISELSGRSNVVRRIRDLGLGDELTESDARQIVQFVKDQESRGFSYEGAAASFELVVRRLLPDYEPPFELIDFMVIVENRRRSNIGDDGNGMPLYSEATIRVRVGSEVLHTAADGNGPVNALDNALRKALLQYYPQLEAVRLTDYKVRVVSEGDATDAVVRVTIESTDEADAWQTVGSSPNVLEASWLALADSMEWWLAHHGNG